MSVYDDVLLAIYRHKPIDFCVHDTRYIGEPYVIGATNEAKATFAIRLLLCDKPTHKPGEWLVFECEKAGSLRRLADGFSPIAVELIPDCAKTLIKSSFARIDMTVYGLPKS